MVELVAVIENDYSLSLETIYIFELHKQVLFWFDRIKQEICFNTPHDEKEPPTVQFPLLRDLNSVHKSPSATL